MGKLSYTQCNSGSFFYTYASRKSCFLIFHLHSSWRYELNLWIHFLLLFPISMLSSKVIQHCMSPLLVSQLALSLQLVCHTTLLISILKNHTGYQGRPIQISLWSCLQMRFCSKMLHRIRFQLPTEKLY